ncbi:ferredoxin [Amycolatopsis sp. Poz14]|uniref:ferredoxin n=1 Tax=Amycolatopsis sp. Poz14 TaxID=1447705 RepID=UPI001EE81A39|nr:ferredoxin [Amycolatopsis sp. Poz14]MCG3751992.1 ferredoxin [Amycolatopsis sp. Poz14]
MTLKIIADTGACKGTACCLMEAPDLCDVDETTGKVVVLVDEIDDARRAEAETAVRACPAAALELREC